MKKILVGIVSGVIVGVIDVIPMMIQRLTIDAILSAFTMWVILGFIINITAIKINSIFKGILLSLLVLTPTAILIGYKEPISLIPILIFTIILGALLGYISGKNEVIK